MAVEEMSLDELKEEIAAEEAEDQQAATVEDDADDAATDETDEDVETETDDDDAEVESDEDETDDDENTVATWQLTDQGESDSEAKFTDSDVAAMRRKFGAKLERKHEAKVAQLEAEIERLKAGGGTQQPINTDPLPTLEDHDYDAQKHAQAVAEWHQRQATQTAQQQAQQTQAEKQQQQINERREREVDEHYKRAATLSKESGITPEAYQETDRTVRQLFDSISPGQGDAVMEDVISTVGEGSEKLMYYIGRNPAIQETLRSKFAADPRGYAAVAYLGELKRDINKPQKRQTRAPKPAAKPGGKPGAAGGGSAKRQYLKAQKAGDMQKVIDIKFAAKAKGIDTSNW